MKRIAFWLLPILILCVGCSDGYLSESRNSANVVTETAPTQTLSSGTPTQSGTHRDVIKSGNLTLQVGNVAETEKKVRGFVSSAGGRVDKVSSDNLADIDATIAVGSLATLPNNRDVTG